MNLKSWIKKLHQKKIVSERPHPAVPFILSFISFVLGVISNKEIAYAFFFLSAFAFIFAILHLIVWLILKER
jgi:uncharacterized membrane protein YdbT with pleckstrin-like domain